MESGSYPRSRAQLPHIFHPLMIAESPPSLYQVLSISETATPVEIRKAYLALCLKVHPDKTGDAHSACRLLHIRRAYETLRDPCLRAAYDARNVPAVVHDTICLSEMDEFATAHDATGAFGRSSVYEYSCRCGGAYLVDSRLFDSGVEVFPCDTCSLTIRVVRG